MTQSQVTLSDFKILRPAYESTQENTISWMLQAHIQAEKNPTDQFIQRLTKLFSHITCKPHLIAKRGHCIDDFLHQEWDHMHVYALRENAQGKDLGARNKIFGQVASQILEDFYTPSSSLPSDLIHVTCTGYTAPSAVQRLASNREWGNKIRITHLYHMGCYAAIPAIRLARDQRLSSNDLDGVTHIAHTELCSLHFNPASHEPDQIVAQSLFADGFIKYSVQEASLTNDKPHFKVLSILEGLIPNSQHTMTWDLSGWGFEIFLAKEIPQLIADHLLQFVVNLCAQTGLDWSTLQKEALFAIHPGGPKVLQLISKILQLEDEQLAYSYKILNQYGNMSSATLPHIWEAMLKNRHPLDNRYVISLAFGPGLTICGLILK